MTFVKVSNVSDLVTEDNLRELFQCCGEMVKMRIRLEEGQKIACIEFTENLHTETALLLSGTELGNCKLQVQKLTLEEATVLLADDPRVAKKMTEYEVACQKMHDMMQASANAPARNDEVKRTVYIGNLSSMCTPQLLRTEFSQIGEVVYVKFAGNNDFRYAFIEFATEQQARMAFTLHGKVIAGQAVKVGTAHNPICKDDINDMDNPLYAAKKAAKRLEEKLTGSRRRRSRSREHNRDRDRGRRRRRRRRRGSRSRSRDRRDEDDGKPKKYWDGYMWHYNDTENAEFEEHTSVIRSDVDPAVKGVDSEKKMQNAALEALKALQMAKGFGY